MSNNIFDCAIIGAGVAGCLAAARIAEKYPDTKTIIFDIGAGPSKRRRQIEGWLGCFPQSDGKIYPDLTELRNLTSGHKTRHAWSWFFQQLEAASKSTLKLVKSNEPQIGLQKKLSELGFQWKTHDYYQWKPESIHQLSKNISEPVEANPNFTFSFENEVHKILKKKNYFLISSNQGDFSCKKILLATGRTGWRWVSELYQDLGLAQPDDWAQVGVRIELAGQYVKEFNKSHCSLNKGDLYLDKFCFNGTIVPEDHCDMVIANFRSNEDRWRSEKVSFSMTKKIHMPGRGVKEAERLAKLKFLLFNDRVSREKVRVFLKKESQLNLLPEFDWLKESFEELTNFIPQLINRGYYHVPEIIPKCVGIKVNSNLEVEELPGMFVSGENLEIFGIGSAAASGIIAADNMCS